MNKLTFHYIGISFFISLVYVGLGTICVLCLRPNPPLDGNWMIFALLITLPVNFISVGIMYADSTAIELVLIIQLIYFLLFWLILYSILKRRSKKRNLGLDR
jgi:Trk-type K+ transport system membrane component